MQTTVQRPILFANGSAHAANATDRFGRYLDAAQYIPGWFMNEAAATFDSLLMYQQASGIAGHMAEIGVYRGLSAYLLALHCNPEDELVLVDIDSLDEARSYIQPVKPTNVHYMQMESFDLVRSGLVQSGGNLFRFISIDGEHTREAVARDLAFANQLLSRDGIIALDDFFAVGYPQITAGVFEFLAQHPAELTLFMCGFNKAYLCRPRAADHYLGFVRDGLGIGLAERQISATLFKTTDPSDYNCFGAGPNYGGAGPSYHGPDWCVEDIKC